MTDPVWLLLGYLALVGVLLAGRQLFTLAFLTIVGAAVPPLGLAVLYVLGTLLYYGWWLILAIAILAMWGSERANAARRRQAPEPQDPPEH